MTKLAIVLKIPKNPVVFVQPNKSTAEKRPKKRINPHFAPAFFQKMRLQNEYKFKNLNLFSKKAKFPFLFTSQNRLFRRAEPGDDVEKRRSAAAPMRHFASHALKGLSVGGSRQKKAPFAKANGAQRTETERISCSARRRSPLRDEDGAVRRRPSA